MSAPTLCAGSETMIERYPESGRVLCPTCQRIVCVHYSAGAGTFIDPHEPIAARS